MAAAVAARTVTFADGRTVDFGRPSRGRHDRGLSSRSYAYTDPSGGHHLRIDDASHVRVAMGRWDQTTFHSRAAARQAARRIIERAHRHGIHVDARSAVSLAAAGRLASGGEAPYSYGAMPVVRDRATHPRLGDRTACRTCGTDIEYWPGHGWVDRGNGTQCLPYRGRDGETVRRPRGRHRPVSDVIRHRQEGGAVAPAADQQQGGHGAALAVGAVGLALLGFGIYELTRNKQGACPTGSTNVGGVCQCPAGMTFDAAHNCVPVTAPVQTCTLPAVLRNGVCVLPAPPPSGGSCNRCGGAGCQTCVPQPGASPPCPGDCFRGTGGARPPCCVTAAPGTSAPPRYYEYVNDSGWAGLGEWYYTTEPNEFANEIAARVVTDAESAGFALSCSPSQLEAISPTLRQYNGFPPASTKVYVGSELRGLCR